MAESLKDKLSKRWKASGNQTEQGDLHLNVAREIEPFLRGLRDPKEDGKKGQLESLSEVASRILLDLAAEVMEEASQDSHVAEMHIPRKAAG